MIGSGAACHRLGNFRNVTSTSMTAAIPTGSRPDSILVRPDSIFAVVEAKPRPRSKLLLGSQRSEQRIREELAIWTAVRDKFAEAARGGALALWEAALLLVRLDAPGRALLGASRQPSCLGDRSHPVDLPVDPAAQGLLPLHRRVDAVIACGTGSGQTAAFVEGVLAYLRRVLHRVAAKAVVRLRRSLASPPAAPSRSVALVVGTLLWFPLVLIAVCLRYGYRHDPSDDSSSAPRHAHMAGRPVAV